MKAVTLHESGNDWSSIKLAECGELYCGQSSPASEVNAEGRGYPYFTGPEQWDGLSIRGGLFPVVVPDNVLFEGGSGETVR